MEDEIVLQNKLKKFLEWCKKNDIQSPKAELRYCGPEEGFGFFAKENFRSNEAVVEVPKNMMITSTSIIETPEYFQLLSSINTVRLEPFELIVLFFYCEHSKGLKSLWKPYISMLPDSFSTPLALDLDPSILPPQPRQLYEKQIIEVKLMSEKLLNFIPDLDYSLFLWAWHCVNTRCIFFDNNSNKHDLLDSSSAQGDSVAVIPLMDMLNHDSNANCLPGFDKYSQKYRVTVGERMVMQDEQLYVCYGPHDNGKLWIEYGFRLSNNLFNNVSLNLDLMLAIFPKINFRPNNSNIQAAKEANFSCNKGIFFTGPHDNGKLWVEYGFRLPNNLFNNVFLNLDLMLAIFPKINFKPNNANIQAAKEANFSCNLYGSEEAISYGLRKTCILLLLSPAQLFQWQRIIYDEDFLEEDSTLLKEADELAIKIIKEISARLQSKIDKADKNVVSLYSDQLEVLSSIIL
uniref:SET domain-containing protein n=1 Tax=Panagrolaimus sp. ES5 TaxID=591445 RepID=A0AC34FLM6_9BILA